LTNLLAADGRADDLEISGLLLAGWGGWEFVPTELSPDVSSPVSFW